MNRITNRSGRVRIAILDTGLDLSRSALYTFGDRVKGYKDWIEDEREGKPWVDLDGHGTHSAALLMKVAPEAEVYVARVFKSGTSDKDSPPTKEINDGIAKVCELSDNAIPFVLNPVGY
jgi:subtilisin family serine protease